MPGSTHLGSRWTSHRHLSFLNEWDHWTDLWGSYYDFQMTCSDNQQGNLMEKKMCYLQGLGHTRGSQWGHGLREKGKLGSGGLLLLELRMRAYGFPGLVFISKFKTSEQVLKHRKTDKGGKGIHDQLSRAIRVFPSKEIPWGKGVMNVQLSWLFSPVLGVCFMFIRDPLCWSGCSMKWIHRQKTKQNKHKKSTRITKRNITYQDFHYLIPPVWGFWPNLVETFNP